MNRRKASNRKLEKKLLILKIPQRLIKLEPAESEKDRSIKPHNAMANLPHTNQKKIPRFKLVYFSQSIINQTEVTEECVRYLFL